MDTISTAEALSTGAGRTGRASVPAAGLDIEMAPPKEMGGSGQGANPEQLFAAGYAACFHSALQGVARSRRIALHDTSVGSRVSIGSNGAGGYGLAVEREVVIPDLPPSRRRSSPTPPTRCAPAPTRPAATSR